MRYAHDIVDHGAGAARDHPHHTREQRQRLLAGRVEAAFLQELLFQEQVLFIQFSLPVLFHPLGVELIPARHGIKARCPGKAGETGGDRA